MCMLCAFLSVQVQCVGGCLLRPEGGFRLTGGCELPHESCRPLEEHQQLLAMKPSLQILHLKFETESLMFKPGAHQFSKTNRPTSPRESSCLHRGSLGSQAYAVLRLLHRCWGSQLRSQAVQQVLYQWSPLSLDPATASDNALRHKHHVFSFKQAILGKATEPVFLRSPHLTEQNLCHCALIECSSEVTHLPWHPSGALECT